MDKKIIISLVILIVLLIPIVISETQQTKPGIEITLGTDKTVHSSYPGEVVYLTDCTNSNTIICQKYGSWITLRHETPKQKFYTFYSHLESFSVKQGDKVSSGTKLGTATKLFFAISSEVGGTGTPVDATSYDPLCFFTEAVLKNKNIDYYSTRIPSETSASCQNARKNLEISTAGSGSCDGLLEPVCKKTLKCWFDSANQKCTSCPSKCEGDKFGPFGSWSSFMWRSGKNIIINNQNDCESNSCGYTCFWAEKCVGFTSINPNEKTIISTLDQLSQNFPTTVEGLNALKTRLNNLNTILQTTANQNIQNKVNLLLNQVNSQLNFLTQVNQAYIISFVGTTPYKDDQTVNYDDTIKLCAVLTLDKDYSSEAVSSLSIAPFSSSPSGTTQPTFTWYKIIPTQVSGYDASLLKSGQEKITYQDPVAIGSSWCITLDKEIGTAWYKVDVNFKGKTISSPLSFNSDIGGIQSYRISRKSDYFNQICVPKGITFSSPLAKICDFISTIESYKNLPFVNPNIDRGNGQTLIEKYEGMVCLSLIARSADQVFANLNLPTNMNIPTFITNTNEILKTIKEKSLVSDMIPELTQIKIGDILVFARSLNDEYVHSAVLYKDNKNPGILDLDDELIYTSTGCITGGNEAQIGVMVDNGICISNVRRFEDMHASILRINV